ncbi:Sodium-dependent glucose transporter 1-like protein [Dinothrombium tinctorium]|uniref:Sodium-dependent glucose transporter 1-like protein n=1 Tax=Dinothrombium tinctorium TaxID=1965070 RepID=A0A3S3PHY7_9ACAR|nr:Sodium-dependent glucose transporter 1-like protein [Dinothrombium tinctorium]
MSLLQEIKKYKFNMLKSCILYLIMFIVGMNGSLPGVTLLDLQKLVQTTLDKITIIFPATSIDGCLARIFDAQILILFAAVTISFSIAYVPWNISLNSLCGNVITNGFFSGFLINGGNLWLLHLWGKESPPFTQAFNFAYGFGALFGSLIAQPFLMKESKIANVTVSSNSTSTKRNETATNIQYPYAITGLLSLTIAIFFAVVYLIRRSNEPHPTVQKPAESETDKKDESPFKYKLAILFACLFTFFYIGVETPFGTLLPTYIVNSDLKLDKATAANMVSLFWATFTFFRGLTIFIVCFLSSETLLITNLTLIMASNFALLAFSSSHEWALWLGIVIMGAGTSSVFGALFGFLQEFIVISGNTSSLILVSVCASQRIFYQGTCKCFRVYLFLLRFYGLLAIFGAINDKKKHRETED